jgi:hypothetical protein
MTQQTSDLPPEAAATQHLLQIATGHVAAAALQVAVKLNVADHLAAGPRDVTELARAVGANEDALYRILRSLTALGVFEEDQPRRFALTAAGALLRPDVPGSVYPLALWISSPFHFRVYADTMHSVRTGQPAVEKTTGLPAFEYLAKDRELAAIFNNAMTAFSAALIPAVLGAYDFTGIKHLVDVGGGHGALLAGILQKYPGMRGTVFDQEHVVSGARAPLSAAGLADRTEVVAGDFFRSVPTGDAYVMKHIIHDWDDEKSTIILKNIRRALEGNSAGRVVLVEGVIVDGPEGAFGKIMDLEMLVLPGGKERTAEEFAALFARSGFALQRILPTGAELCVIEARPV